MKISKIHKKKITSITLSDVHVEESSVSGACIIIVEN